MSTLRIEIKDSKFVSHNGINLVVFEENYVKGNGWEAKLSDNGKLECVAIQHYSGKQHLIKFKIQNGYVKLILKIGEKRARTIKSFKLKKWPINGIIGLPGGYIDSRRPYIRELNFQKFLDEHGLDAVRYETANGIYHLDKELKNGNVIYEETIETDGKVILVLENDENGSRRYLVTEASWVIKTVVQDDKTIKLLYTTEKPEEISNLPKN